MPIKKTAITATTYGLGALTLYYIYKKTVIGRKTKKAVQKILK